MCKRFLGNVVLLGWISFILLGMCGCAKKTTVVLLPDPDGTVGRITVANNVGSVEMANPGEVTVIPDQSTPPTPPEPMSKTEIDSDFSTVLSILPTPQEHFHLYFIIDTTKLTQESNIQLPQILDNVKSKQSQDIRITGHTDTSGDSNYNQQLSQRRAELVTKMLIDHGVLEEHIETHAFGEEIPQIKTVDNVYEPRNRRVEVIVW